ncbi:MAG: hypothetical protein GC154_02570 [bacterium]|nr:hypothetical protein [bacterium]
MMFKTQGLLSLFKALAVLLLLLALPGAVFAQSDTSARVAINSSTSSLKQVLLIKDGDNVTVYGLASAVPPYSVVTIAAGTQTRSTTASAFGNFPIVSGESLQFNVAGLSEMVASVTVARPNGSIANGTFTLNVQDASVLTALEKKTIPPSKILDIKATNPDNESLVGHVLLSQKLNSSGGSTSIIDEYEGIASDAGSVKQSLPDFAQIEVYRGAYDANNPAPAGKLVQVIRTEGLLTDGTGKAARDANGNPIIVSNGYFFPFGVGDSNSGNTATFSPVISMRVTSTKSPVAFQPFWAQITSDVEVEFNVTEVIHSPNGVNNAIVNGTADPYAIVTAYAANDKTSAVLASVRAGADGSFSMLVPPAYDADGFPVMQSSVYVLVQDPFNNSNANLIEVVIDDGTVNPQITSKTAVFPSGFQVSGVAESRANIRLWAVPSDYQIPDQLPETLDDLPAEAYFYAGVKAAADGTFSFKLPTGISRLVAVDAIDSYGHKSQYVVVDLRGVEPGSTPDTGGPWRIAVNSITNNLRGGATSVDLVNGTLYQVNADGSETPSTGTYTLTNGTVIDVVVTAYKTADPNPSAPFPFINELTIGQTPSTGAFSLRVPNYDQLGGEFVADCFVVALGILPDDTVFVLSFEKIDASDGFDRVGPTISFAPLADDIQLVESGKGTSDIMNIGRIYVSNLPADALPFVVVLADDNDDNQIDVNNPNIQIVDFKPLNQVLYTQYAGGYNMLPIPGVNGLNLGDNYWDAETQSVYGHSVVFVSLIDQYGNLSPNPIAVELDVTVQDPDKSAITASGTTIYGVTAAVEANSHVVLYENADKSGRIASTDANDVGAFYFGGLSIQKKEVYVLSRDAAGNTSNPVKLKVENPVMEPQYVMLDGFGLLHTPNQTVSSNLTTSDSAQAFAGVENVTGSKLAASSPLYVLNDDGAVVKIGSTGDAPLPSEQITVSGRFARDIEVVKSSPFSGYVLLGNGVVIPYGNAPFYGDLSTLSYTNKPFSPDSPTTPSGLVQDTTPRLRIPGSSVLFDDLNRNGVYDNEDENGNGKLDQISVPYPPYFLNLEDANGNGKLDQEPKIDPSNIGLGFSQDIARDLEVVVNPDGSVAGYVILDGNGVLWTFGSGYGEEVINNVTLTNGFSADDIFRDLELVIKSDSTSSKIVDFITLNGYGQLFAAPGGLLGAGPAEDPENRGNLSGKFKAPGFNFDIARDMRLSPVDVNEDGQIDWHDGYYILDGYGGVHAVNGATPIEDTPFLGFDIARDLEFTAQTLK